MSDNYTPTTEEVRHKFSLVEMSGIYASPEKKPAVKYIKQFDRWLAEYERELRNEIAQEIEYSE